MKKRNLALLFLASALCVAFSACSSDENADTAESEAPVSDSSEGEAPVVEGAGILSEFKTQDLNEVEYDQTIFADYDLTMVNIWGTYCPPCLEEMPYLGELSTEYADKGVQIVGIVIDVLDQENKVDTTQKALAIDIAESTGANYTHLLPSTEMFNMLSQTPAVPTTIFVDSTGKQVGLTYVGSRDKDGWIDAIEETLAEVE